MVHFFQVLKCLRLYVDGRNWTVPDKDSLQDDAGVSPDADAGTSLAKDSG